MVDIEENLIAEQLDLHLETTRTLPSNDLFSPQFFKSIVCAIFEVF